MKLSAICFTTLLKFNKHSYHYTIVKNPSGLYQINGSYTISEYNKMKDPLRYGTNARKKVKYFYHKKGFIEDHHIIPKEFSDLKLLGEINYDVAASNNIYILPSVAARTFLPNKSICHTNHRLYNSFIRHELNKIDKHRHIEDKRYSFLLFYNYLRGALDKNDDFIGSLFDNT